MELEEFLSCLDPKTAKRIKTAQDTQIERLPVASYGLTKALGGGIGRGRVALTYGNTSSGKSLLWEETIALWQRMGHVCALVDIEEAYEKEWGAKLGINNKELILIQSKSSARIEAEIRPLLENNIDAIVMDSISDIIPAVFFEKDGSLKKQEDRGQIGAQSKAIKALIDSILYLNQNTAVSMISQTTTEIGQTYVKQIPHGGKKIQFSMSQIIKLTSSNVDGEQIKGKMFIGDMEFNTNIGRHVNALVEKNKLGPQHTTCEYDMYYSGKSPGIDMVGEVVKEAIKYGVIKKGGSWFSYGDNKWQGQPMATSYFKEFPDALELVKKEIAVREDGCGPVG